jgi:putative ABC transport system substrate-binding protein
MQRAAYFIDRIVKGASPADLPIELPTDYVLVVNPKTAAAFGLTVPPTVLQAAAEVVE